MENLGICTHSSPPPVRTAGTGQLAPSYKARAGGGGLTVEHDAFGVEERFIRLPLHGVGCQRPRGAHKAEEGGGAADLGAQRGEDGADEGEAAVRVIQGPAEGQRGGGGGDAQ